MQERQNGDVRLKQYMEFLESAKEQAKRALGVDGFNLPTTRRYIEGRYDAFDEALFYLRMNAPELRHQEQTQD